MKQYLKCLTMVALMAILASTVNYSDVAPVSDQPVPQWVTPVKVAEAKAPAPAQSTPIATDYVAPTAPVQTATVTGSNFYMDYIFKGESGGRLDRVNSIGCYGLGQDCNDVLATDCPNWRTDEACQMGFWERYMLKRYGSWEIAYNFWIRTDPRPYPGHWW